MTYYVESEGCFLVNLKRALNGEGLKGGAWTASIRKGKKFSTLREARKVAEQLSGAHVYRLGTRDLFNPADVQVGDIVENRWVGESRVEEVFVSDRSSELTWIQIPSYEATWIRISYEGVCWSSGETRRYERSDPLGVYGGEPYFRRVKKRG